MNNTIKKISFAFLALSMSLQSCDKGFIDLNTDPVKTTNAYPSQFMANAFLNAITANMSRNRSFTNELMQVTVSIGEGDGKVFRYDFRPSWSSYLWDQHYKHLMNFKDMYLTASEGIGFQPILSRGGITWSILVGLDIDRYLWRRSLFKSFTRSRFPYFRTSI
ncbi:SusD/RagB family nutrient-binding outer membrane lipoprotein [Sphingobacterium sp. SG20118]|uniref:SusD/RagB family nutrient-binding outer membrane lipoprotein n=1 Tax=Sphingobacterium sp. SG20118 TaxID=3367156 RepID=UPI0037DFC7D1